MSKLDLAVGQTWGAFCNHSEDDFMFLIVAKMLVRHEGPPSPECGIRPMQSESLRFIAVKVGIDVVGTDYTHVFDEHGREITDFDHYRFTLSDQRDLSPGWQMQHETRPDTNGRTVYFLMKGEGS